MCFLASVLPFTYPTCTVLYGQVSVDLQNGGTSLCNFVPNCGLFIFKNIHYGTLIVAATCFIPY